MYNLPYSMRGENTILLAALTVNNCICILYEKHAFKHTSMENVLHMKSTTHYSAFHLRTF